MSSLVLLLLTVLLVAGLSLASSATQLNELWFPKYHPRPEKNWVNDPNFPYRDTTTGLLHLFMQYNPTGIRWGNMAPFHLTSPDYVKYHRVGVALWNNETYNKGGVFSGSMVLLPKTKTPMILYTCVDSLMRERQCCAVPANLSDPQLVEWNNCKENPIIAQPPPHGDFGDFRDPTDAVFTDPSTGEFRVAFGASLLKTGSVVTYKFPADGSSGSSARPTFENAIFQSTHVYSHMEECPDFAPVEYDESKKFPLWFLKTSNEDIRFDFYRIGLYDSETNKFTNRASEPSRQGEKYFVDFGQIYASKSFDDPILKARVWYGWINEDYPDYTRYLDWAGAMSLPRAIHYDTKAQKLKMAPLDAIKQLRDKKATILVQAGQKIDPASPNPTPIVSPGFLQNQHEILVNVSFNKQDVFASSSPMQVLSLLVRNTASGPSGAQHTKISFEIPPASHCARFNNTDFGVLAKFGGDLRDIHMAGQGSEDERILECEAACRADPTCLSWTYVRKGYPDRLIPAYNFAPRCSLKYTTIANGEAPPPLPFSPCCVSGVSCPSLSRNEVFGVLALHRDKSGTSGSTAPIRGKHFASSIAGDLVKLSLRVFIDASFIEVFADDGLGSITSRVYIPHETGFDGVSIESNFAATIDGAEAFTMKSIWS